MLKNSIDLFYEEVNNMKNDPLTSLVVIKARYTPEAFEVEDIHETDVLMDGVDFNEPTIIDEIETTVEWVRDHDDDANAYFWFPAIYHPETDSYDILIKRMDKNEYVIGYRC